MERGESERRKVPSESKGYGISRPSDMACSQSGDVDEYEFQWRQAQDVPRTPLPLEPEVNQQQEFVGAESSSYGSNYAENYTTAQAGSSSSPIVEEITRGIAQMNTDPFHIGPRARRTQFEKFDKSRSCYTH